jgi:hypothetical protein
MIHQAIDIFAPYEEKISSLGLQLRDYLFSEMKGINETVDIPANMLAYSYGPGYKGMVCTIIPSKKGIKLGFNRGTELPDPAGLLTGSGKLHKYVEIKSGDIQRPELKKLLEEAVKACQKRLGIPS